MIVLMIYSMYLQPCSGFELCCVGAVVLSALDRQQIIINYFHYHVHFNPKQLYSMQILKFKFSQNLYYFNFNYKNFFGELMAWKQCLNL